MRNLEINQISPMGEQERTWYKTILQSYYYLTTECLLQPCTDNCVYSSVLIQFWFSFGFSLYNKATLKWWLAVHTAPLLLLQQITNIIMLCRLNKLFLLLFMCKWVVRYKAQIKTIFMNTNMWQSLITASSRSRWYKLG